MGDTPIAIERRIKALFILPFLLLRKRPTNRFTPRGSLFNQLAGRIKAFLMHVLSLLNLRELGILNQAIVTLVILGSQAMDLTLTWPSMNSLGVPGVTFVVLSKHCKCCQLLHVSQ